ncbi:bifunctional dethiobiotin synthetase/7,8-diamino-pelargonic acid aminotransferase, mitochondrial isoform X2 [Syzygium oleosum]|uniref:bifunctional dethiobiotin synthetase/7,8-diamino-pelargonic acid aminotransferase, mitochondrial isoform X2 n=1 Tax=Syzygium oleosum TaxID=219896 RepID=UPI0024BA7C0E|nr:bifunctional dethiobiotin synthetase/7,8-diamino-pelargonic acid aminotransferase, mitochondrial isoform X2 [Syzygium oleosum]
MSPAHLSRHRHRHQLPLLLFLRHHRTSSSAAASAVSPLRVPLSHPAFLIWSSNTSVGKTLVATGLAFASLFSPAPAPSRFHYLKPVQTGFPSDSDSLFLFDKLASLSLLRKPRFPVLASHRVLRASAPAASAAALSLSEARPRDGGDSDFGMVDLGVCEERRLEGERSGNGDGDEAVSELVSETVFAWKEAVSPHLAAEREGGVVEDSVVVEMVEKGLRVGRRDGEGEVFCVIETSGGVASPGPSGTLQCDLYRPFRLPAVLVGDGRLGGISATISAYESLRIRGYDVVAVVFEDHGLLNEEPLMAYFRNRVPVLVLPHVPEDPSNDLMEWFIDSRGIFDVLKNIMKSSYLERMQTLLDMPKKARDIFWWPFTQHTLVSEDGVTVIDSRHGENFTVFKDDKSLNQMFDACASWWTQGPNASLQTELARDMGYAAARFGHVMFPENVYEPALECAELLLGGVGEGWASRVYFSDNGSTAIEIALKMAFRVFSADIGILPENSIGDTSEKQPELLVLALKGSYHGDTLGAMEAQSPSAYTSFIQQPWYTGRGLFLDPPTVFLHRSVWKLSLPAMIHNKSFEFDKMTFSSRDEIFCKSRDESDLSGIYSLYISQHLSGSRGSKYIGALIIEPVIQGSGGMLMVDPLFQRVLVNECQRQKIPVIFDEVFTGFWRLGTESAAELLGCVPDIACFAKLMTGGMIPLAVTLATNAVFTAFLGESKLKALLHGHSYSAHAVGCTAATKSIKWFKDPQMNHNIIPQGKVLRELWDFELVTQISSHPAVQRVISLGTLFALELRAEGSNAGYASLYSRALLQMLREDGVYLRPLGNVIYLMCGPCTPPETCSQLLVKLQRNLEAFHRAHGKPETDAVTNAKPSSRPTHIRSSV